MFDSTDFLEKAILAIMVFTSVIICVCHVKLFEIGINVCKLYNQQLNEYNNRIASMSEIEYDPIFYNNNIALQAANIAVMGACMSGLSN